LTFEERIMGWFFNPPSRWTRRIWIVLLIALETIDAVLLLGAVLLSSVAGIVTTGILGIILGIFLYVYWQLKHYDWEVKRIENLRSL